MQNLPRHIAIIPDGSRRWAGIRNRPCYEGHVEGVKRFREISKAAFKMGIPYFTFWAVSEDNLTKRNSTEVNFLVSLFFKELESERALWECRKHKVEVKVLGRWDEILGDERLRRAVTAIERRTMLFERHHLTLLFGYDGRQEMVRAIEDIVLADRETSHMCPVGVDTDLVKKSLWTYDMPPVDLVIRTGEDGGPSWAHNSSGFMMWDIADARLFFTEVLWPDFTVEMFRQTITDYSKTSRRFGA